MGEAVEHFSYDLVGNRTTDDKTSTTWNYNQNNELQSFDTTSFKYNLNGQMTEKTVNGTKTYYSYNLDGRLKEIKDDLNQTIATYQYDPYGRRISKALPKESKTIYFHYSNEGIVGEYNLAGQLIQSYGYKPNSYFTKNPVFTHRPDFIVHAKGGYVYYLNDLLGTPQKLITETGRKVWEAQADTFGKTIITNNEFRNPLRFPGQYYDEESDLHQNYFRYYDLSLGRYITSDSLGLGGGINEFGYVYGNPLVYYDPNGKTPVHAAVGAVILIGAGVAYIASRFSSDPDFIDACYDGFQQLKPYITPPRLRMPPKSSPGPMYQNDPDPAPAPAPAPGSGSGSGSANSPMPTPPGGNGNGYNHGGGKNGKHSNPNKRAAAQKKWNAAKKKLDDAKRKGASKKDKAKIDKEIKHWKREMDNAGENHSMKPKGNQ